MFARRAGLGTAAVWIWNVLQWPVAFVLLSMGLGLVYYVAPDAEQDWVWVSPGAILATGVWLMASLLFRVYVASFGNYQATYGALGGVIVLLLWMYITGLIIIVGAEMNAEIEHASPWGKNPGEKVAGQRKKIGSTGDRRQGTGEATVRRFDGSTVRGSGSTFAMVCGLAHRSAKREGGNSRPNVVVRAMNYRHGVALGLEFKNASGCRSTRQRGAMRSSFSPAGVVGSSLAPAL